MNVTVPCEGEPVPSDAEGTGELLPVQLELFEKEIENEEKLKTPGKLPNYNSHIRRERFARLIFQGEEPANAYFQAGYSARDKRNAVKLASRLLSFADVRGALDYWRNEAKAAEIVTFEELAAEAWKTYHKAPSNAVSGKVKALDLLANIGGHKNPLIEIKNQNTVSIKDFLAAQNEENPEGEI